MAKVRALPGKLSKDSPFPPDCASRFALIRPLGEGGFGAVFLATQLELDRPAAVKVLLQEILSDTDQVERFVNEARITASIAHPSVVKIYDDGAEYGVPWIAYEYLQGRSLRQILMQEGLTVTQALAAAVQVAGALEASHAVGVLHRDIKPDNVLEVEKGRYKVTDFGLAKWSGDGGVKTATGLILGTPEYIAPELAMGRPASQGSDLYALGVMLFELVTGELPFRGDTPLALLQQHMTGTPPLPSTRRPGVSGAIDRMVMRCLARDLRERYASASDLRKDLEGLLTRPGRSRELAAPAPRFDPDSSAPTQVLAAPAALPRTVAIPGRGQQRVAPQAPQPPSAVLQPAIGGRKRSATREFPGGRAVAAVAALTFAAIIPWRLWHGHPSPGPESKGALLASPGIPPRVSDSGSPPSGAQEGSGDQSPSQSAAAVATGSSTPGDAARPPGTFTGGWQPYRALLPRLQGGGEVARRTVSLLRKAIDVDLGPSPANWASWISLNEWLAEGSESGPSMAKLSFHNSEQVLRWGEDLVAYTLRHEVKGELTPQMSGLCFEYVGVRPEDPRAWLLLGRLLALDHRDREGRRAYARGLQFLDHHAVAFHSQFVWDALARALYAAGGQERVAKDLLSFLSDESEFQDAIWGLRAALDSLKVPHGMEHRILTRFKDHPRLGPAACLELGNTSYYDTTDFRADPDRALKLWTHGLDLAPQNIPLNERMVEFYLCVGDLEAALIHAHRLPDDDEKVVSLALVSTAHVSDSDRSRVVTSGDHPGWNFLLYVLRELEADDFETAATLLARFSPTDFWRGSLGVPLDELLAHGVDRAWFARQSDALLVGDLPWWDCWMEAAGAYANPAGRDRMQSLLTRARAKWPGYAAYFTLLEALWHSRSGEDGQALTLLADPTVRAVARSWYTCMLCEIQSRPIWKKALGDAGATDAANTCMHMDGPKIDRPTQDYWAAIQAGDLDKAAQTSQRVFWRTPTEPLWSLVAVWNAARTGDRQGLAAAILRGRIACRANRSGVWPLREMARIEKRFAGR